MGREQKSQVKSTNQVKSGTKIETANQENERATSLLLQLPQLYCLLSMMVDGMAFPLLKEVLRLCHSGAAKNTGVLLITFYPQIQRTAHFGTNDQEEGSSH